MKFFKLIFIIIVSIITFAIISSHNTPTISKFNHRFYWSKEEKRLDTKLFKNRVIYVTGGSSGIGKELVEYLNPICNVSFCSGPRTPGGVDLSTEMGVRKVISDIDEIKPDTVILNAGCHSPDIDINFLVNLSAPLRIVRHLCMHYPDTKVIYIGSRASRFYDNIIGTLNPYDNSYGCAKYMMTAIMFAQKTLSNYAVWAPPALPTSVRSKKKLSNNKQTNKKIREHAKLLGIKVLNNIDHMYWEYERPTTWRPNVKYALSWLHREYKVNGSFLLGKWLGINDNYSGNVNISTDISFPNSESSLLEILRQNKNLEIIGSGHSYNPQMFDSTKKFVNLCDACTELKFIKKTNEIIVGSGVSVFSVSKYLKSLNRTLQASGSHGSQSFVAALITGTHGHAKTGATMATSIVAMKVYTYNDDVIWITDEETLCNCRVMSLNPENRFRAVLAVKVRTFSTEQSCKLTQKVVNIRDVDINMMNEHDFSKISLLPGRTKMMVSVVDYEEKNKNGNTIDTSSFPTAGRHGINNLIKIFIKIVPKFFLSKFVPSVKTTFSDNIDTSIIYNGTSTSFTRWVADITQRQPHLNSEFAVDAKDFSKIHSVLSHYNNSYYHKIFEYRYRYSDSNTNAVHALDYKRPTVFVDIHVINTKLIDEVYKKFKEVCEYDIRVHMSKIQPSISLLEKIPKKI